MPSVHVPAQTRQQTLNGHEVRQDAKSSRLDQRR